jgi:hypothetical protein
MEKNKNENVEKNELKRMRNLEKEKNVKIKRVGFVSADKLSEKKMGKDV